MRYVSLDLEWNQPMTRRDAVASDARGRLEGEVIEIGAVMLDEKLRMLDEFKTYVTPVFYRQMNRHVSELTGIDESQLMDGLTLAQATEIFRSWCGDDVTFLIWGCDDIRILKKNMDILDIDHKWIVRWYNLQTIFNQQTDGAPNQKSLSVACQYFSIPQSRPAHDALNDAYYTACIAQNLDIERGVAEYPPPRQKKRARTGRAGRNRRNVGTRGTMGTRFS